MLLIRLLIAQVQASDRASMTAPPAETSLHTALSFDGGLLLQRALSRGGVWLCLGYGIG